MFAVCLACAVLAADPDSPADKLLAEARVAWNRGDKERALMLSEMAVKAEPKNALAWRARGSFLDAAGQFANAAEACTRCLDLDPKRLEVLDRRGSAYFKAGKIKESVADFDRYVAEKPSELNGHWRRGISLYYAGRYADGRAQFEGYEKVDTNDVENAVWHFLCAAREMGVEKARGKILKIGRDRRVPMSQVYDLYRGEAKPEDVLKAATSDDLPAEQGKSALFYAHLYLGIYHDLLGDAKKAREHLTEAAGKYRIAHYMGDVARVHLDLLDARKP